MSPTVGAWEHPSESAASVSAPPMNNYYRGAATASARRRRSARIAAIRLRAQQRILFRQRQKQPAPPPMSLPAPQPAPTPTPAPARPRDAPRELSVQQGRLSPAPADTAESAAASTSASLRSRHASLAHVMWRTLLLMHSNRLLALQVEALKRETSAFVCSVLRGQAAAPSLQDPPRPS